MTPDEATEVTRTVMRRLDLTDPRQLLHVPASALLRAQMGSAVSMQPGTRLPGQAIAAEPPIMFWPFVDGHMLPEEFCPHRATGFCAEAADHWRVQGRGGIFPSP
jgi:para-nitrobenzyl esterase